jgi:hypothetical protein
MKEKSLLLFETKELAIQKYNEFLKETPWEIYLKQNIESFLDILQEESFDLIIIEESMAPDEVISMLSELGTPLIISTNSENAKGRITISRDFSAPELINAIGKASFLKVVSNTHGEKAGVVYSSDDSSDEDEPVLLEPVFEGGDEDAVILSPENDSKVVRSSFEIPEKKESDSEFIHEKENKNKKDIFARIDEIDSILTSLGKDIEPETKSPGRSGFQFGNPDEIDENEKTVLKTEPFQSTVEKKDGDEKSADFLFDDDYEYEEPGDKGTESKTAQPEFNTGMVNDFEAILTDKPLNVTKVDAKEFEIEPFEEKISEPAPVEKEKPVIEETPAASENTAKEEIIKWLEANGRKIIKEIVLEQLSKLSGKDG